jgi:hypothetical protein
MVAAFGSGKPVRTDRWLTRFPRLDRAMLARCGALDPGMKTHWSIRGPIAEENEKEGTGAASALLIKLAAAPDGLTISTGDQVQVVRYWYDRALPHGGLRQFWVCPCGKVARILFFENRETRWACRVCLRLRYPSRSTPAARVLAVHKLVDPQRTLVRTRPGSRHWHELRARIDVQYKILSADVARVRRDLRRRLKNDYRR